MSQETVDPFTLRAGINVRNKSGHIGLTSSAQRAQNSLAADQLVHNSEKEALGKLVLSDDSRGGGRGCNGRQSASDASLDAGQEALGKEDVRIVLVLLTLNSRPNTANQLLFLKKKY